MVTTDEGNEFNTLQMVLGLRIGKAAGRQGLHGSLIKMLKKDLAGEGGNVMTMLHTLQHQTARRGLTDDAAVENNGSGCGKGEKLDNGQAWHVENSDFAIPSS